jgi:hypothetical protein
VHTYSKFWSWASDRAQYKEKLSVTHEVTLISTRDNLYERSLEDELQILLDGTSASQRTTLVICREGV